MSIKIRRISNKRKCDNCKREMPYLLEYTFSYKCPNHNKHSLCEDCSESLGRIHRSSMEHGKPFEYDLDEIKELEEI
ncbi:MAG: hypothetical protein RR851_13030 [Clostridium sp.]